MEEIKERCISKKEYLKKYDSNVGYALYVRDNIKKDDYARLNTGEIVKVLGIRENNANKKAIYYGIYETDWFDSAATENFSDEIIDLIECEDYVNGRKVMYIRDYEEFKRLDFDEDIDDYIYKEDIKTILTKEQFEQNLYKV